MRKARKISRLFMLACMCPILAAAAAKAEEVVIRNGTILTVTRGTMEKGSVLIRDGKIVEIGKTVHASPSAKVIDATGKYVMPGIVDAHSHIALDGDINEATAPVTPHMVMADAFQYDDKSIYHILAGGVTSSLLLHGSANMIGGQALVIKHKFGKPRDALIFQDALPSIKFASGENPKRVYGGRQQMPSTRMGNFFVLRQAMAEAKDYIQEWEQYNARLKKGDPAKAGLPPKKDLKLEALADILRGKFLVQIHCYRADEFLTEMRIAREYGYPIRAFHHALEAYKVADELAKANIGTAIFADWWGYKVEAWDAIPWAGAMLWKKGVRVAVKSDSEDFARRLNQEAAKLVRYGGVPEEEALAMITINPAWIAGIDHRVGSLEPGKDADIAIWDAHPLSIYAKVEKVLIEGEVYFDRSLPGYGTPFYATGPKE